MQPDEKITEKIKRLRRDKKWSQEDVAQRLNMATSTYSDLERGVTQLSLRRLEELAKIFDTDLAELIGLNAKNIFNLGETHNSHSQNWYNNPASEQLLELQHELEKTRLENDYLKQQNADLREMVNLLKQDRIDK